MLTFSVLALVPQALDVEAAQLQADGLPSSPGHGSVVADPGGPVRTASPGPSLTTLGRSGGATGSHLDWPLTARAVQPAASPVHSKAAATYLTGKLAMASHRGLPEDGGAVAYRRYGDAGDEAEAQQSAVRAVLAAQQAQLRQRFAKAELASHAAPSTAEAPLAAPGSASAAAAPGVSFADELVWVGGGELEVGWGSELDVEAMAAAAVARAKAVAAAIATREATSLTTPPWLGADSRQPDHAADSLTTPPSATGLVPGAAQALAAAAASAAPAVAPSAAAPSVAVAAVSQPVAAAARNAEGPVPVRGSYAAPAALLPAEHQPWTLGRQAVASAIPEPAQVTLQPSLPPAKTPQAQQQPLAAAQPQLFAAGAVELHRPTMDSVLSPPPSVAHSVASAEGSYASFASSALLPQPPRLYTAESALGYHTPSGPSFGARLDFAATTGLVDERLGYPGTSLDRADAATWPAAADASLATAEPPLPRLPMPTGLSRSGAAALERLWAAAAHHYTRLRRMQDGARAALERQMSHCRDQLRALRAEEAAARAEGRLLDAEAAAGAAGRWRQREAHVAAAVHAAREEGGAARAAAQRATAQAERAAFLPGGGEGGAGLALAARPELVPRLPEGVLGESPALRGLEATNVRHAALWLLSVEVPCTARS